MNKLTQGGLPPIPDQSPKKKSLGSKLLIFILVVFVGIPFLIAFLDIPTSNNTGVAADSTVVVGAAEQNTAESMKADSLAKAKEAENQALVQKLKNNFRVKKDEFEERSWVRHKKSAIYTNVNSVQLYFQQSDEGHPSNLRFRVQYEDDDWLFISNMIFNIDGENITFTPMKMETDCGNGGRIWEWCDESATLNSELVAKIANAKKVKIKLNGSQYYDTRTMSSTQLKAFKETFQYYQALGGSL